MRSRGSPYSEHGFAQRLATLEEILEADGEVIDYADLPRRSTRYVRVEVAAPGYGSPRLATYEYEEWYRGSAARWHLTDYQYELRFEPPGSGRKAYHWHDRLYHFHCAERRPSSEDHYRGYEVDLLEDVRPELLKLYAEGRIDCSGLHPL